MAVPFRVEGDNEDHSYLRIENLLKELLTLLRWMPWTTVTEMPTAVIDNSQAAFMQQRRQTAGNRQQSARGLVHHHRRLATTETHNRPEEQQQQQLPLPDLIMSSMSATPPPPPPPPPPPQPSADKKPTKKILLEVELCPECYYDHQKFKVVAANRRDKSNDGSLSRRHRSTGIADRRLFDNDGEESVFVVNKTNVKQRLMSLLTPSKIDSSILTAVFVIIGWKMFIKQ